MKTDVFGARLTGIHKIKEEESHQFFFFHIKYAGTAWDQISFRKKRRSIHGLNCHSLNFFKLLNSSLKTKTELHNSLFCAVVVCLTSFFVRRTRAHHAEFN